MTPYSQHHELCAWGERRSAASWAADARCSIDYVTLLQRIERGWHPEDAITSPIRTGRERHTWLTAFGETKSLADWVRDPRATGGPKTLLWRLRQGWRPEEVVAGR